MNKHIYKKRSIKFNDDPNKKELLLEGLKLIYQEDGLWDSVVSVNNTWAKVKQHIDDFVLENFDSRDPAQRAMIDALADLGTMQSDYKQQVKTTKLAVLDAIKSIERSNDSSSKAQKQKSIRRSGYKI